MEDSWKYIENKYVKDYHRSDVIVYVMKIV